MWYSNVGKKDYQRELFADLEMYDLTDSTIAYILGIREHQVWKWRTGQCRIPPKPRKKLAKLIQRMGKSPLLSW